MLTVEADHGQAFITLRAGLGQTPRPYRGPAYQRRHERSQAARTAAEIVGAHSEQVSDSSHNDVVNVSLKAEDQVADKATEVHPGEACKVNEAEEAPEIFGCSLCDFKSNWGNGLNIHMTRKHGEIEQLDENAKENDETKQDEKYAGSKHYWEEHL